MKPPLRLWIRVLLSVLAFPVPLVPQAWLKPVNYLTHGIYVIEEKCGLLPPTPGAAMGSTVSGWRQFPMPPEWLAKTNNVIGILASLLPSFWAVLLVYHLLTFRGLGTDRLTRCGHCGNVLKNLTRPECPACARAI